VAGSSALDPIICMYLCVNVCMYVCMYVYVTISPKSYELSLEESFRHCHMFVWITDRSPPGVVGSGRRESLGLCVCVCV
jgi:hypothetical protein